jgi:AcrR family transcriptional regulator
MDGYVAADTVKTPWGNADELRTRRLRPGPGASREEAARNQRERLYAAMVASASVRGYSATTVADLLKLAGVSRATFYEHFADKGDCFRATLEALLQAGLAVIHSRLQKGSGPEERAKDALGSFLRLAAEQPAAARVSLVEAYAAGPDGLEPINSAFEEACELAHEAFRQIPDRNSTSPELARAVIGGLHRVLYMHLYRDEEAALLRSFPALWRWAIGFPPPRGLDIQRRHRSRRQTQPPNPGRDLHERILRAFCVAIARRGASNVAVAEVAAEASISQATFYQHFENKHDALLAALDLSGAQLVAAVLPSARRAPDWPQAMRRAIESLCGFLVSEPAFARLRIVEVYAAGPEAIEHRDRSWSQIVEEVVPADVLAGSHPGHLAVEASSGAMYALLYEKVRRGEFEELRELPPLLTYLMLTPFLGPERANEMVRAEAGQVARA